MFDFEWTLTHGSGRCCKSALLVQNADGPGPIMIIASTGLQRKTQMNLWKCSDGRACAVFTDSDSVRGVNSAVSVAIGLQVEIFTVCRTVQSDHAICPRCGRSDNCQASLPTFGGSSDIRDRCSSAQVFTHCLARIRVTFAENHPPRANRKAHCVSLPQNPHWAACSMKSTQPCRNQV